MIKSKSRLSWLYHHRYIKFYLHHISDGEDGIRYYVMYYSIKYKKYIYGYFYNDDRLKNGVTALLTMKTKDVISLWEAPLKEQLYWELDSERAEQDFIDFVKERKIFELLDIREIMKPEELGIVEKNYNELVDLVNSYNDS